MQKKTPDYDNVFKTMKMKHRRLFIPVINDIFGKNYPMDAQVEVLASEGYLSGTGEGGSGIGERVSDFLMRIGEGTYLLECQSSDDGSMAIRMAEYAFTAARQSAEWGSGHVRIPLPHFSVIYVKRTERTPGRTVVTFVFPDGREAEYGSDNVILENLTKEYITGRKLYPYIPYYMARYEKEMISGTGMEKLERELEYFRDALIRHHGTGELTDEEAVDLMDFVNVIITHITNGNENEERLVKIMGGTVIETASEKLINQGLSQGLSQGLLYGKAQMIVEIGREDGLGEAAILKRLREKAGLSPEEAREYLEQYGKQPV